MSDMKAFAARIDTGRVEPRVLTYKKLSSLCRSLRQTVELDGKKYVVSLASQFWPAGHPEWGGTFSEKHQIGLAIKVHPVEE